MQRKHRFNQTMINHNSLQTKAIAMEWDPKLISETLSKGEQVAVPKEELNIIMKNLDYHKIGDQVIETLDYE